MGWQRKQFRKPNKKWSHGSRRNNQGQNFSRKALDTARGDMIYYAAFPEVGNRQM